MIKLLLDTDIGSDIDDVFALAYLLCQPECELLGITTVTGEAVGRAKMASAMCKAVGKDHIPVYPGASIPLIGEQKQLYTKQAEAVENWPHQKDFPVGGAVEFMRQTIRRHPGEVTLLAIGPMTNVGMLFAVDPEIPSLLKELVVMCGIFDYKTPAYTCLSEWNSRCDPYASAIVYNAPVKNIKSIGLDVTVQVTMEVADIKPKLSGKLGWLMLDFISKRTSDKFITFHDPLAAAVIFKNDICGFMRGNVEVELDSTRLRGLTYWEADPNGKNEAAFTVDSEGFFRHYFEILG